MCCFVNAIRSSGRQFSQKNIIIAHFTPSDLTMRTVLQLISVATAAATGLRDVLTTRSDLSTFTSLLDHFEAWELFEQSSTNVAVMAPNNAAYDKLLEIGLDLSTMPADFTIPVLRYHLLLDPIESSGVPLASEPVLMRTALTEPNMTQPSPVKMYWQGIDLFAEGGLQLTTKIVEPDIKFSGGTLHVLDASLVAPHNISATVWMNGVGNEFLKFIEETDMVSEIESLHDATLFIPSNEAWQRSYPTLSAMSLEDKRMLLLNHAIEGRVAYRDDLRHRETLSSVTGRTLQVMVDEEGSVAVEGAKMVQADILWFNGVAHIIDRVLMYEQVRSQICRARAGNIR